MANFDKIFDDLIMIEAGYSNHPHDSGGRTMYGITEVTARDHGYQGEMKNLTLEEAKKIYNQSYFSNYGFDKVQNTKIAGELFEFTVNTGRGKTAVKFLQRAFNLLNKNIHLEEDGILGPMTASTINNYKFYKSLFKVMNLLQGMYYISITEDDDTLKDSLLGHTHSAGDTNMKSFIRGWIDKRVSV